MTNTPKAREAPAEPNDDTAGFDGGTVEASFAVLELCLEQLSAIAPIEQPEQILDLIPEVSLAAKRLILVELIKYDLAVSAENGTVHPLDFYWPASGEILPQEAIPFDLVLEEVQLRRAAGEKPKWSDYRQRFPDLANTIGKWLAGGETQAVTGATSQVPELPVGEQVDDFQILKQLGQGAFARVYLARQESMHRLVALKATTRGSDEPQALSKLDHANVVRVYDQRTIAEPPTILLYMQYLAGGTLADCVKHVRDLPASSRNGERLLESIDANLLSASQVVPEQSSVRNRIAKMDWAEVVAWIGIQLADGLHYANSKGVLHRDIKPANILMSSEAVPKLADFNVSCSGIEGRAGAAAYFGGSLAYMSPEQLQVADPTDSKAAADLDGRSDLYALGIVLWELWQGRRPWTQTDVASNWTEAVLMQKDLRHREFSPVEPASTSAERVLERVLRSLLSVDPERRPKDGNEVAARLKLAFYPELANRFEPPPRSVSGRLLTIPVLLISAILIFGPNTAASLFNYQYNKQRMPEYGKLALQQEESETVAPEVEAAAGLSLELPEERIESAAVDETAVEDLSGEQQVDGAKASESAIEQYFKRLSNWVNGIVFPLGGVLFLAIALPIAVIVNRAKLNHSASEKDLAALWNIGNRATQICGVLWAVSGCVFAYCMWSTFPRLFALPDAVHFFLSLVLCGGVAWIYPYFGMTLLSLLVYYPKVIAPSMSDPKFDARCRLIRRTNTWYLLSAAALPLFAVGALVYRDDFSRNLIVAGVCITGLGLVVAYLAHQRIDAALHEYAKVLGDQEDRRRV